MFNQQATSANTSTGPESFFKLSFKDVKTARRFKGLVLFTTEQTMRAQNVLLIKTWRSTDDISAEAKVYGFKRGLDYSMAPVI